MATTRIKDITTAASTFSSDDFVAIDGATSGTRKMAKADLISEVSSGVSGTYLEESNNLSDVASLDTSKLNMEIPDVGTAPNEVPLNGQLGTMAFQDASGVSVGQLAVTDKVDGNLGVGVSPDDYDASGQNLVVGNTASNGGITVVASPSHTSSLLFADGTGTPDRYVGGMTYEHTSNAQKFYTSGNLAATIDSAGRVGLNQTSPGSYWPAGDDLVVGNASDARGITISSGATSNGAIYFADGTTGDERYRGWVTYNQSSNSMSVGTAATERLVIDGLGALDIQSVNGATAAQFPSSASVNGITALPSATGTPFIVGRDTGSLRSAHFAGNLKFDSGYGIDFGSGATLDSYEVGTWSPSYTTTSSGFTNPPTMDVVSARYVKVGDLVTFFADIRTDSVDLTGAGTYLLLGGLPYAATVSSGGNNVAINVAYAQLWANAPAAGYVQGGQNYIYLTKRSTSITGRLAEMSPSDLTSGTNANHNALIISGSYYTTA